MMPRTGEIGEQIFDQVEKLVADGMNRTEAFAKISADSGRRAGTVAANYYRVARKRAGGSLRPRRGAKAATSRRAAASAGSRANGRRRRTTAQAGGGDIDRIANALVGNIEQLTNAVKAQSREVAELRSRLDGIRRLLD
jgi:hypothetical protein